MKYCPKCSGEMSIEEVLTGKTTQADLEDSYSTAWICEDCGHEIEIDGEPEDNTNN